MNKRKKYAAVFSCLVLITAFGAGIAGSRSAKREQERQRSANEAMLLNEEAKTVDINKNANPNGVKYNIQKENGSLKEYYQNTSTKSNDSGESPDNSDETKNTEIKEKSEIFSETGFKASNKQRKNHLQIQLFQGGKGGFQRQNYCKEKRNSRNYGESREENS